MLLILHLNQGYKISVVSNLMLSHIYVTLLILHQEGIYRYVSQTFLVYLNQCTCMMKLSSLFTARAMECCSGKCCGPQASCFSPNNILYCPERGHNTKHLAKVCINFLLVLFIYMGPLNTLGN